MAITLDRSREIVIPVHDQDERAIGHVEARWADEPELSSCAVVAGPPVRAESWTQDADGEHYHWTEAPRGRTSLWLRAPGYRTRRVGPFVPRSDGKTELGIVHLEQGRTISGSVLYPDGHGASNVLVRAMGASDPSVEFARTQTDPSGRFTLDVATGVKPVLVAGRSPGPVSKTIPVESDETTVELPKPSSIRVAVTDTDGKNVDPKRVRALRRPEPTSRMDSVVRTESTGGVVRFDGLDEGRWTLEVFAPGYAPASKRDVVTHNGATTDVAIVLAPGETLEGRVKAKDDSPVVGAVVRAALDNEPSAVTDERGVFVLGGLKRGRQRIIAEHPESGRGWIDAEPGREPVEIRLSGWGSVEGTIHEADAALAAGMRVEIEGGDQYGVSDPAGSYRIDHVAPGRRRVILRDPRSERESTSMARDVIVPEGGSVRADFVLGCDAWGQVTIDDVPVPEATVRFVRMPSDRPSGNPTDSFATATADREGRFEIFGISDGRYTVAAIAENVRLYREVSLGPGRNQVDLALDGVVVHGTVLDGATGSPLDGAELTIFNGKTSAQPVWSTVAAGDDQVPTMEIARGAIGTASDALGRFAFHAPIGHYTVQARRKGYRSKLDHIEVQDKMPPLELLLDASGQIDGVVVTSYGAPAVGAQVAAQCGDATTVTMVEDDGAFSFTDLPTSPLCLIAAGLGGELVLTEAKTGSSNVLTLAPHGSLELNWASSASLQTTPVLATPDGLVLTPSTALHIGVSPPVLHVDHDRVTAFWQSVPAFTYLIRLEGRTNAITVQVPPGSLARAP
jgi:hypothetical protein